MDNPVSLELEYEVRRIESSWFYIGCYCTFCDRRYAALRPADLSRGDEGEGVWEQLEGIVNGMRCAYCGAEGSVEMTDKL